MASRERGLVVTNDFDRDYKCITKYLTSWRMADYLAWADALSKVVLFDVTLGLEGEDPAWRNKLTIAVHDMHDAVSFFCRPTTLEGDAYEEALTKHEKHLRDYATIVEVYSNGDLCKANLHLSVCRLGDQCR